MGIFIILTRFPTDIFPVMMSLAAIIIIADKAPLKIKAVISPTEKPADATQFFTAFSSISHKASTAAGKIGKNR